MTTPTPATGTDDLRAERSRRGRSNRNRGAAAERAVAKWLRANGFPGAERAVRAAYVGADHVLPDPGDITGTPGIVWQIKDSQREYINAWLDDTDRQRAQANAKFGLLIVRRRGWADPGQWWCWISLDALTDLVMPSELVALPVTGEQPVRLELWVVVQLLRAGGWSDDELAVLR